MSALNGRILATPEGWFLAVLDGHPEVVGAGRTMSEAEADLIRAVQAHLALAWVCPASDPPADNVPMVKRISIVVGPAPP
jgi:hypothetical protein